MFPEHGVTAGVRARDVLLAGVHEWHGRTPIVGAAGEFERVPAVLYYRADMWRCLPSAEESDRLTGHRPGGSLGQREGGVDSS